MGSLQSECLTNLACAPYLSNIGTEPTTQGMRMSDLTEAATTQAGIGQIIEVADQTLVYRRIHVGDLTPTGAQLALAAGFKSAEGVSVLQVLVSGDLEDTPQAQTPYSLQNVYAIIVPLPGKVFAKAESTERVARDHLQQYCAEWPKLKAAYGSHLGTSVSIGDTFVQHFGNQNIVARTYLTYGWKYKSRMLRSYCASELKETIQNHDFPRFVWVTEFGVVDSFNQFDESKIRIAGHCVQDATSNEFWDSKCIFHAPGLIWTWSHRLDDQFGNYKEAIVTIRDEQAYGIKIRGA